MPPFTEPHVKKWKGKFSERQKSRNSILEHNSPSMTEGRTFEQKKTLMEIHFSESIAKKSYVSKHVETSLLMYFY